MAESHSGVILVVDDDLDTCSNLSDILTDLGYRVDTADDGRAAIELVRKTPYDVALLDLKMPGMDGLTLYREIKKSRSGTVGVIVTAYAGCDTAEAARAAGAWQVLPKPVDFPKLLGIVDAALSQPLVMVVDDEQDLCSNLWDLFREQGYRVCIAHNELQAAGLLNELKYKVVLVDMKLSDEHGGTPVYQEVRRANPGSRVVLITGFRAETDKVVRSLIAEGAEAVCYKPFDMPKLLETLKRLAG